MKKLILGHYLFFMIILLANKSIAQGVIYVAKPTKWIGSSGRNIHGNLNGNFYDLGFSQKNDGVDPRDQSFYYRVYSVTAMDSKFQTLNKKIEESEKAYKKELDLYKKEIEELKSQIILLKKQTSNMKKK